jgi:hypothetical protein
MSYTDCHNLRRRNLTTLIPRNYEMEPAYTPPSSPDWIDVGVAIPFSGAVTIGGGGDVRQ